MRGTGWSIDYFHPILITITDTSLPSDDFLITSSGSEQHSGFDRQSFDEEMFTALSSCNAAADRGD